MPSAGPLSGDGGGDVPQAGDSHDPTDHEVGERRWGIRRSVTTRCQARAMGAWTTGEVLGFDLETTGIDRFNDVPVSYTLVQVVDGIVVRTWSGLIDPGREIPAGATEVHGISTERARDEGMPLATAVSLLADAVVSASRRGVPLVGMKLDYDLTMVETQAVRLCGQGIVEKGWCGPVLDAGVIDRHFDPARRGRRTLVDLCGQYGIEIERAHDRVQRCDRVAGGGLRARPPGTTRCSGAISSDSTMTRSAGIVNGRRSTTGGGSRRA